MKSPKDQCSDMSSIVLPSLTNISYPEETSSIIQFPKAQGYDMSSLVPNSFNIFEKDGLS